MNKPVTLAIIGAGKRGEAYSQYVLQHPELAQVVAIAEPREILRERMAKIFGVPPECCFASDEEFARRPRMADAALICTQDRRHCASVQAIAPHGYAILLEKPMSASVAECENIIARVKKHGNLFAVCHVLLYMEMSVKLRQLVRSGAIGDIITIQHIEPVGWWHQAHSFVRGNWRNEADSAPMLMAKSCHDMDWMRDLVNKRCTRVASFGSLRHFKASEKPDGASDRCWDCGIESTCPYSAKRIYLRDFQRTWLADYLNDVITEGRNTREAVEEALRTGPYGRCVYACDNDVVDNQTVMLEYEGPVTATFTMTAFTPGRHRNTRICGTLGFIEMDFLSIKHFDFLTEKETTFAVDIDSNSANAAAGHGGADYAMMSRFVHAVATGDTSGIYSGADATLESHRIVFAAEQARKERRIVEMSADWAAIPQETAIEIASVPASELILNGFSSQGGVHKTAAE